GTHGAGAAAALDGGWHQGAEALRARDPRIGFRAAPPRGERKMRPRQPAGCRRYKGQTVGDEYISLARVLKTQGRHGEVAVEVHSDVPDRFVEVMWLLALDASGGRARVEVETYR